MPEGRRVSIYLSQDEWAIADAIAARQNMSRSEVVRHLVLYQGMCGGDFPLTARIISLPTEDRARIIGQIRERCEAGAVVKPQAFRQWVKESTGSDDPESLKGHAGSLLDRMLRGDFPASEAAA